ncbi:malate/L-sulfolactate dehydrogenase [Halococcus saccharolyticus DSM 5350]|uniref:Malate/L-sulfolactate dehydrogenase n=1 Tax=Halococcus saccharolyticus DSM 5350 TaxID=1227455 RepID=M0MNI4_9EURY|nr:malate/L-sulfolactate dehydrogenase [Halococcus saccharolyticus DSM 5350]
MDAGGFNSDPEIDIDERSEGALVVDADNGPGQSAGKRTMERLISMSKRTGVAVGVVRNSNHFGTAAYYTEMAADEDCIGMAMTNVPAEVIPFGGREPYLGTNPIAVSVPSSQEFPITLDMATSVVAMGKIDHVAAEKGEQVPENWGVDDQGEPTTDPEKINALRPLGGAKGYGLGVVVELLAGLLSGANHSVEVSSLYDEFETSMGVGHFYLSIDVATLRTVGEFIADVDRLIEDIKNMPSDEGVPEVLLPGEIEARAMEENLETGVPVDPNVFRKLETIAEEYVVESPSPRD